MGLLAGGRKAFMSRMSFSDETWHIYMFPKEDPEIHNPRYAPIGLCYDAIVYVHEVL